MAKQKLTVEQVNAGLKRFLINVVDTKFSAKRDQFDETLQDELVACLQVSGFQGAVKVTNAEWKGPVFETYRERLKAAKDNFDMSDLPMPKGPNGEELNLLVVDKPYGSNAWPDILLMYNGIGFPIEAKSGTEDKIVWNSGMPRHDSLYIFNWSCAYNKKTTCFLGGHRIAVDEYEVNTLKAMTVGKLFNDKAGHGKNFFYYARAMFNEQEQSYFKDVSGMERVDRAGLEIAMLETLYNAATEPKKKKQLQEKLHKQKEKRNVDEFEAKTRRNKRVGAEAECVEFVSGLTWNSATQKTDFSKQVDPAVEAETHADLEVWVDACPQRLKERLNIVWPSESPSVNKEDDPNVIAALKKRRQRSCK